MGQLMIWSWSYREIVEMLTLTSFKFVYFNYVLRYAIAIFLNLFIFRLPILLNELNK